MVLNKVNTFDAKAKRNTRLREITAKMTNLAHEMDSEMNAKELAKREKISVRAIGIPYAKLRASGHPLFASQFNQNAPLSPEQIAILRPGKFTATKTTKKNTERVATFATPVAMTPEQGPSRLTAPQGVEVVNPSKKTDWQMLFFWALCGAIVLGHAGLVWFDCAYLWGIAGKLAGGIVFTVVLASLVLMSGKRFQSVSANMMWFVWLIEACAWFVHWPSFKQEASIGYSKGINDITTQFLAAFICLCAIAATYFYRQTVIEK